jgi:hypothetical protein
MAIATVTCSRKKRALCDVHIRATPPERNPLTCRMVLKLIVCILLRVLGQVQGVRLTQHWFEYLFSNRYMFRSYDHLQAETFAHPTNSGSLHSFSH